MSYFTQNSAQMGDVTIKSPKKFKIKLKSIDIKISGTTSKEKDKMCARINLKRKLYDIIQMILQNPTEFIQREAPLSLCTQLNSTMSKKKGQGRANGNTTQETSFAYLLEQTKILHIEKNKLPIVDGCYYIYQPNGSQRSPDFRIYDYFTNVIQWSIDLDMKQSNTDKIILNDGWFNMDTVYILSYKIKGQDIPTVQENEKWEQILKIKKELNSGESRVGSLLTYFRFANQYNCIKFTSELQKHYMSSISHLLE